MSKLRHIRWLIAVMLFLAAVLNYVDRQTLSILAPTIQSDLNLSDASYARIVNLFLIAYTIATLLSGRFVDKVGVRIAMALFVTWWSVSNILTGLARSATSLGIFRCLLGFGEAGNWPGSAKAVSEWFPPKERAFAIGFYTLGATIGATLAPVLILAVATRFHWQAAFVVTGLVGLLWVPAWLWLYRSPDAHPRVTPSELAIIRDGQPAVASTGAADERLRRPWITALCRRDVWVLVVARFLTDPVWYFYQFWFAKYLFADRGVDQNHLKITWVVYLAADIGSLAGGLASGFLIKRGSGAAPARLRVMLVCALVMPLAPLIPAAPSLYAVLAIGMLAVLAHLAWLANISALVVDLIPARLVATCFGIVAAGSAVGGILMNNAVVYLIDYHSYAHWFVITAFLHPLAWLILRIAGLTNAPPGPPLAYRSGMPPPLSHSRQTVVANSLAE